MKETLESIQESIKAIQDDSTLMLMGGVTIAILLAITLIVVVSIMKVKWYKDRFKTLVQDNQDKAQRMLGTEQTLQQVRIEDAKKEQELEHYADTKDKLDAVNKTYAHLQKSFNENEKLISQLKAQLDARENMYNTLSDEHKTLQKRIEKILEDNTKYQTSNARLLMKLESLERRVQE